MTMSSQSFTSYISINVDETTYSDEHKLKEDVTFQLKHENKTFSCKLVLLDQSKIKISNEVFELFMTLNVCVRIVKYIPNILKLVKYRMSPLDFTWKTIFEYRHESMYGKYEKYTQLAMSFDITYKIVNKEPHAPYLKLYEDNELADFEIRAAGGNVKIHKNIWASASPVFKNMVTGEWKERSDRFVTMMDTSKETLENFKKYLYLGEMPNSLGELKNLLLFASQYMIEDLDENCIKIIVSIANKTSVDDIIEFSVTNGKKKLTKLILDMWVKKC